MKIDIFWKEFLIILIISLISTLTHAQSPINFISKKGGICFRTDDNQAISKYLEYASIFNRYNQKFSFAINLGLSTITSEYVAGLQQLQTWGHEMMDHTPRHMTNRFSTILDPEYFRNHPGVHRISDNRIELNHLPVDTTAAKRSGFANVDGNIVSVTNGLFSSCNKYECYLYFPSLNELVFINDYSGSWIDSNTVKIEDVWNQPINLGYHQNIKFYNFHTYDIHVTVEAVKALAEESLRLSSYFNLGRPYALIQPGGYFPNIRKNEAKLALETSLGYKTAGVAKDPGLKVFNEYNPYNDKQFGMNWGDFKDESSSLEECTKTIADRVAKHHVVFGASHFQSTIGGWSGFLDRTDKLIQWCVVNNIPIRTYSEWSDILYRQMPEPNENIFPPLNIDLDGNNIPDGYNSNAGGKLDTTDGYPSVNDYCFSSNKAGGIFSIGDLAGIEKGENDFGIWTKGASGNFIEVIFKLKTSFWSGTQDLVYKFPAENSEWTYYNLSQSINGNTSLNIPFNISLMNVIVQCSNYSSGTVKVSGMKFAKYLEIDDYLYVTPQNQSVVRTAGFTNFNLSSNLDWTVSENESWLSISPTSGVNNETITAEFTENLSTTQRIGTITITGGGITRSVTVTQQGFSGATCPPSIVSYWKLDETSGNVYDDFTGTNNASSTNTPTPVAGRVDGAQQFNGSSNRITAPVNEAYNWSASSNFTFESWMKHPNVPNPVKEFIIGRKAADSQLSIWLGFEPSNEIKFSVRSKSGERGIVTGPNLFDDTWHHVVAVKDGSFNQLRLYVDGVLVNTVSAFYSSGFDSPSATMSIGWRDIINDESVFNGIIDEVAIYNIALDSATIQQHYNSGSQNVGYCEPLLAPTITSSAVANGIVGQLYSYDVDAYGNPTPTFSLVTFPNGMTIDTTSGVIQWLPTATGNFAVSVKALNGVSPEAMQPFIINVTYIQQVTAPTITSTAVTVGNTLQQYVYDVNASGAPAPEYSLTIKPIGMVIDSISGIIQWSPADSGSYNVTVVANNGILPDAEQSFIINVELAIIPNITSIPDTIAIIGQQHVDTVMASGNPSPKYYLITKPMGMIIDSISGRIEWTPDSLGIYQVELKAENIWGEDTLKYNIEVQGMAPVITSTALLNAYKTQLYIYDVNATGMLAPKYYLEVKPAEMIIDSINGIIQWTPLDSGSYSVTVKASNNYGTPAIQSFEIHVTDLTHCPENIISYWKLNEVFGTKYKDLYNLHDAEVGSYAPTPVAGKSKGGQRFDGINDEINIPASNDFDFGANNNFTIEFWIKRTYPALKRDADIVIGRTDSGTLMRWWVGLNNASKPTFQLRSITGETYSVTGATAIADSNWHHIVAVRDGGMNQLRIFTDGKPDGTIPASYTNGFDSPTADITLGWLSIGLENTFYGTIDEVAIYSDIVDTITIQRHYFGGLGEKDYCDCYLLTSLKLFLEGAYDSTSMQMNSAINSIIPTTSPYSQDPRTVDSIPSNIIDWVLIELRSSASGPANAVRSLLLHKSGNIVMDDGITPNSIFELGIGSYYIIIKHRNTIETWSETKQQFDLSVLYYDFTSDSSKAYGNNMKLKGSKWCIYGGDVNQDGLVNSIDLNLINDDAFNYSESYLPTDLNGDNFVDLNDLIICDNNNFNSVSAINPIVMPIAKPEINTVIKEE